MKWLALGHKVGPWISKPWRAGLQGPTILWVSATNLDPTHACRIPLPLLWSEHLTWIWPEGINSINSMDMSLSKLQELVMDRGLACCRPWGRKESDMTEQLNWAEWKARRSGASLSFRSLKTMFFFKYSRQVLIFGPLRLLFALPGITFVQDSLLHILKVFPLSEFIPSYPTQNQPIQTSKSNPSKYLTPLPGGFFYP